MTDRERRTLKLPKKCECGGTLHYQRGAGGYIGCYCDRCTPIVKVKLAD